MTITQTHPAKRILCFVPLKSRSSFTSQQPVNPTLKDPLHCRRHGSVLVRLLHQLNLSLTVLQRLHGAGKISAGTDGFRGRWGRRVKECQSQLWQHSHMEGKWGVGGRTCNWVSVGANEQRRGGRSGHTLDGGW